MAGYPDRFWKGGDRPSPVFGSGRLETPNCSVLKEEFRVYQIIFKAGGSRTEDRVGGEGEKI